MKLHRFIGNFDTGKANLKVQDKELVNQIRNVLRLEKGEEVILGDGNLNEAKVRITEIGRDFVGFEILERWQNQNEPEQSVVLYCSVLKKENFELVAQKATEAGVKEIVPVVAGRTVKLNIRQDRLEKIIKEAAEQSGRGVVPILREPINFQGATDLAKTNSLNLFLDISGESFNDQERLIISNEGRIGIWIGSEGGWTEKELDLAQRSNFKIINIGKLTLRAETAAIVATYMVVHNCYCR